MENNTQPETGQDKVTWDEVEKIIDKRDDDLADNVRYLYRNFPTVQVNTMEEFFATEAKHGDFVITGKPAKDGGEAGNQSVWILLHEGGKCLLFAGQETEDIDWFFRFGSVDIIRIKP